MNEPLKLLDCPFCGSKAFVSNDVGDNDDCYVEFISCYNCEISTPPRRRLTKKDYDLWNTRAKE